MSTETPHTHPSHIDPGPASPKVHGWASQPITSPMGAGGAHGWGSVGTAWWVGLALVRVSAQPRQRWPSSPSSCLSACRLCASVSAWIRSARPSTSVRFSFPWAKARLVNSPASAGRSPGTRPAMVVLYTEPLTLVARHHHTRVCVCVGGGCPTDSPRACRTPLTTAGPPCTWNSAQSSPVKLRGPSAGDLKNK